jgi:hypothetical protein
VPARMTWSDGQARNGGLQFDYSYFIPHYGAEMGNFDFSSYFPLFQLHIDLHISSVIGGKSEML